MENQRPPLPRPPPPPRPVFNINNKFLSAGSSSPQGFSPSVSPHTIAPRWHPPPRTRSSKLRRAIRTGLAPPGIRALFVYVILLFVFISYGYRNFYRDPGSLFFDPARAYERWYSLWRERQAVDFIRKSAEGVTSWRREQGDNANRIHGSTNQQNTALKDSAKTGRDLFDHAGPSPAMCISFITVSRETTTKYVDAAIGSLLHGLSPAERADFNLKVFYPTMEPQMHPSWTQPWLRALVDEVYTYNDTLKSDERERLRELDAQGTDGIREKGVMDYSIALRHCFDQTSAPYIAILEDDTLLADGWFLRSLLDLRDIESRMERQYHGGKWLYMRLFNQERSTGWASQRIGGNNEFWIILGVSGTLCAILVALRRKSRRARAHFDNWTLAVICCLAIPTFVILFFRAGKASLLPPLAGVKEEPFGCCSQGLIFPRHQVPGLLDWLRRWVAEKPEQSTALGLQEVGNLNKLMRDYATEAGLARWALYPVQMQHLGTHSTTVTQQDEVQAVWSMAFESLNPKSLSKNHARMLKEVYGINATMTG